MKLQSKMLQKYQNKSWWIQNTIERKDAFKNRNTLQKMDDIIFEIEKNDKQSAKIIKDKFVSSIFGIDNKMIDRNIPYKELDNKEIAKINKILNFSVELRIYQELKRRGYQKVVFVKENGLPDLRATYKSKSVSVEVKNLNISKIESEKLRISKPYENIADKILLPGFESKTKRGLRNKINSFVSDALKKFKNVKCNFPDCKRILAINYMEGFQIWVMVRKNKERNLLGIFGKRYISHLERENKITIWTRKYFR